MSVEEQFSILKHNGRRSRIVLPHNIRKPMRHERLVLTFAPCPTSFNFKRTTNNLPHYFRFVSLDTVGAVLKSNDKEKNENPENSSSIVETRAVFKNDGENIKNRRCIAKGEGEKGHNKLLEEFSQAKSYGNSDPFSLPPFTFGKNFEQDSGPRACCDLLDDVITSLSKSSTADTPIISSTRNITPENAKNEQSITKGEGKKGHNELLEEFSQAKSHGNSDPFSLPPFTFGKNLEQDSVPSACCDLLDDVVIAISKSSTADTPVVLSTHNVDPENIRSERCVAKGGEDGKQSDMLLKKVSLTKDCEIFDPSFPALPTFSRNFEGDSAPKVCHDLLNDIISLISKSSTADSPIISSTHNADESVKSELCIAKGGRDEKSFSTLLKEVSCPKSQENFDPLFSALLTFSETFQEDSIPKVCHDLLDGIVTSISKSSTSDTPLFSSTLDVGLECVNKNQRIAKEDGKRCNMLLEEVSQPKNRGNFVPLPPALPTFGKNFEEISVLKDCHDVLCGIISAISKSTTPDIPIISLTPNGDLDCVKNEAHIVKGNGQRNGMLLGEISQPKSHENFAPLFPSLPTFDRSFEEDSIPKVCRDLLSGIITIISESSTSDTLIISPTHDNHECTKNKQNVAKGGDRKKHCMLLEEVLQPKSHGNLDPLLPLSPTFSEKFEQDSIPKMCHDLLNDIINEISESSAGDVTIVDLDCVKNEPHIANGDEQKHSMLLEEVSQPESHGNFVPSFPALPTFGENLEEGSIPKVCRDLLDGIITSISESSTFNTPIISPAHNEHQSGEDRVHVSKPSSKQREIIFIPDIPLRRPGNSCFFALVPIHPKSLSSVNAQNWPDNQQFCLVILNKIAPTNSEREMKSKQSGNDPTTTSKASMVAKIHCGIRSWPEKRYDPTKFCIDYATPRYIRMMQNHAQTVTYTDRLSSSYNKTTQSTSHGLHIAQPPASCNKTTQQNQLTSASHGLCTAESPPSHNIAIQQRLRTSVSRVLCTAQLPAGYDKTVQQRLLASASHGLCIVQPRASSNKTTQQELLTSVPHGPHQLIELKCCLIKMGPFKFQASYGLPFVIANVTPTSISFQALKDTVILKPPDIKELICCISPSFPLMLIDVTAKCAEDLCNEKIIPRNPAFRTAWKNQRRITFLITSLNFGEVFFLKKVCSSGSFRTKLVTRMQANDLLFKKPAQTEIKTQDTQMKTNSIWAPRTPTRPQLPPTRPQLPPTRPQLPPTRPQLPPTRPQLPPTRPQLPPTRPQLPPTRPQLPPTRLQLPPTRLQLPPTRLQLPPTRPQLPPEVTFSKPLLLPKITIIPNMKESAKQRHLQEKVTLDIKPSTLVKQGDIHNIKNCMKEVAKDEINSMEKASSNPNLSENKIEGNSENFVSFKIPLNNVNISRSEEDNNSCTNSAINNQNTLHRVYIKQEDNNETNSPQIPKAKPRQVLASDSTQQLPSPQLPLSTNIVTITAKHFVITEASEKQRNLPENDSFSIKLKTVGKTSDIHNVKNCVEKIAKGGINFVNKFTSNANLSEGEVKGNSKNIISSKNQLDNVNTSRHGNNTNSLVNGKMNNENDLHRVYIKQEDVNISLDENCFSSSSKCNSANGVEEGRFGHHVSGVRIKVEDVADDLFFPEDYRDAMKENNFSKRFIQNILCDTDIMEGIPEVEKVAESESVFQNHIRNIYDYEKCLKNNNFILECNMAFSDESRINTNHIKTEADAEKWANVNSNNMNEISSPGGCNMQSSMKEEPDNGIFSVEDYGEESKQHILKCHIEKYMKDILPLKNTFNNEVENNINAEIKPSSSAPNPSACMQDVSMHVKTKTSQPLAIEKNCNNNIADSVKVRKRNCCNNEKYPKPKLKRKLKGHYVFRSVPSLDKTVLNKSITALHSPHSKTVLTNDLGDQRLPHSVHKASKILKNSTCSRSLKNVEADPTASFPSKENPLKKKRSTLSWSRKARHKLKGRKQGPNFIDGSCNTTKKYKKVNCQLVHHPKFDDATLSLLESSNTHGVNAISKTSLPSIKASSTNLTSKCKKSNTENSSLPEHTVRESCDKHSTDIPYSKTLHSNKIRPSLKLRIKKCVNGFKGSLIEDDNLAVDADKLKDEKFCESRASEQYKDAVCNKTSRVRPVVTQDIGDSKVSNNQLRVEKTNNSTRKVKKRLKIDPVITNSFNMSKNVNDCD